MFISSGNIIETIETSRKTFGKTLAEYMLKGFSGGISYRNTVANTYISIEMVRGAIVLCRGIEKDDIVEGRSVVRK